MKIKEIYVRWLGIPIVALAAEASNAEHMSDEPYWFSYFVSLCFTAVYWNGASIIIFYFRKKFAEISETGRRLIFTALAIILWMSIGGTPIKLLFGICTIQEVFEPSSHTEFLPFNFIAATVISLSYEVFYFFEKWKASFRLNEELKNQQVRTQYEVLQNQMSPHFLFNSLNTLASIIPDDPKAAVAFTENLSEVYRYILQTKDRELVKLEEELEFVRAYLFLLKIRYPENLNIEENVDEAYQDMTIPPLTLQMLVENAIKHNVISKARPLNIEIYVENGKSVVVKNNLQKKETLAKSTKTGLENIRNRYGILGKNEIDVITSASNFMVAVPLIDLLEDNKWVHA